MGRMSPVCSARPTNSPGGVNRPSPLCQRTHALSPANRGQALRIVKETLLNVREHSAATSVAVHVETGALGVRTEIIDDGTGFVVGPGTSAPGHRGLAKMVDRASVAGGWCSIDSDDRGTTVGFWMPYDSSDQPASAEPLSPR